MKAKTLFPFLLLVVSSPGCWGPSRPADLPKLFPVELVLTQEGRPLVNANVMMYDQKAESKWAVSGSTDSNGLATMYVNGLYPGAPAGEFKVTVIKLEHDQVRGDGSPPPTNPHERVIWEGKQAQLRAKQNPKSYNLVAPEYGDLEKSPLTVTVQKGKNRFEHDTGKAVRNVYTIKYAKGRS